MAETQVEPIFDIASDDALESGLDAQAEADVAAGRVVPHEKVIAWLKSWGTAEELSRQLLGW